MRTDPITLQILRNFARATAESMATTLYRTAHSTFVKETEDFTIQLLDADGKTVSSPIDLGATWYPGHDYGGGIALVEEGYEPGDIVITNDPYSGYLATHTPDIVMWKPVFHEGKIISFAGGHIHNVDVGGAVPTSLSRALTDVHQEGIRIPPTKLYRRGVLDASLLKLILTNVRIPEQNWGDLQAQVASVNTGERRTLDLVKRFGAQTVVDGFADLLDYAEAQARSVLRDVPDGDYSFAEYCDEDGPSGDPLRLHLTLKIRGDGAELDFTGSDPQTLSSLNVPIGNHPRHSLLLVGAYYVLSALRPGIMLNFGTTRAFTCHVPEGSVLNAQFPAAVGMRSLTCGRLRSLIFGAFAMAVPERMPSAPAGATCIINMAAEDRRTGKRTITAIAPIVGGAGGMPHRDGTDGSGADSAYLKNSPIEITESEAPVHIVRYGLMPDTGGPGAHRGGMAQVLEFKATSPDAFVTARNRDRSHFQPWAILGGTPGKSGSFMLNPETPDAVDLGNTDAVRLAPGDVLRVISPSGAGRGDPATRDPAAVLRDIEAGRVTIEGARRDYGVVIVEGEIQDAETHALRAEMPKRQGFDPGPTRRAHEVRWNREAYAAMHEVLATVPVSWRAPVKKRLFAAVKAAPATRATSEIIREAFEAYMKASELTV
ncbi:MAG: hydantoin utilization protein B [Rhizobiales bacterium PAR1]|nr:MAG: hydantoin utilization protein B [Rhizobiales bacterium PAR1]